MGARTWLNWMFTSAGTLGEYLPFKIEIGGINAGNAQAQIRSKIELLISENKVIMFSKSYCPHCHRAKKIFDELNQKYAVVELNKLQKPEMDAVQDVLKEITRARTVPRVFINGKCIGGGAETAELLATGKLQQIISSSGEVTAS